MEPLSVDLLAQMSRTFYNLEFDDADLRSVTGLLDAIREESGPMRDAEVADLEPATLYAAESP